MIEMIKLVAKAEEINLSPQNPQTQSPNDMLASDESITEKPKRPGQQKMDDFYEWAKGYIHEKDASKNRPNKSTQFR